MTQLHNVPYTNTGQIRYFGVYSLIQDLHRLRYSTLLFSSALAISIAAAWTVEILEFDIGFAPINLGSCEIMKIPLKM